MCSPPAGNSESERGGKTKNIDLDGAVEATLERPEINLPMKAVKEWMLRCCCAQKYLFKVVVALPGVNVVNAFQNLPLFSKTEEYLKGWAMFCVTHWATVSSWAALLLSQCAVCEWCVKAWKSRDMEAWFVFFRLFLGWFVTIVSVWHLSFPKDTNVLFQ